jgi:hypothetical protein
MFLRLRNADMPQIAVKISEPIFAKLKRLAHQGQTNYASIVEAALSAYEPGASEHASHGATEIHSDIQALIQSALAPVLERLAMLESLGLVKHPHPTSITVEIAQDAPESALDAQAIPEHGFDQESPQITSQSVQTGDSEAETESDTSPHPVPAFPAPARLTVKEFIAHLVELGERSPTKIAKALNQAGYRTKTGTPFERSSPQIAAALKAKD